MIALFRFCHLLWVIARFRLDTLASKQKLPIIVWLALLPLHLFPHPKRDGKVLSRGQRLHLALESLGPVYIKFGQLLSTRPDLIPADIVEQLNNLQDNVPPFASDLFIGIVEDALEQPVDELFAEFSREPLASASVAQVHTAKLKNGQEVVVKAVRPGLAPIIEKDIALMRVLAHLVERFFVDGKRLRPLDVVEDYRLTIFDELNLQREAANASQLRRHFTGSDLLYIPEVYWDYCRPTVMVMERIYGIPVTDLKQLGEQNTNMKALAERGVEIFFSQVFEHNFFHADMHPGNIFVARKSPQRPQYIAVDMAIVGTLDKEDQFYLARNMLAMFRRDYRQVAELHVQSGWVPEGTRVSEFEAAIRTVCEPVFEKPLKDISFGLVLMSLFDTARRFQMEVQPQLVLLQKTLLNIEGLGRQLYPDLDLWNTAHPYLERWLKKRYCPKTLLGEFSRYAPEWLEKFPQTPQMLFNALEQAQQLSDAAVDVQRAAQQLEQRQAEAPRYRRRSLLGYGAIVAAAALAIPQLPESLLTAPAASWVLIAIGVSALLSR